MKNRNLVYALMTGAMICGVSVFASEPDKANAVKGTFSAITPEAERLYERLTVPNNFFSANTSRLQPKPGDVYRVNPMEALVIKCLKNGVLVTSRISPGRFHYIKTERPYALQDCLEPGYCRADGVKTFEKTDGSVMRFHAFTELSPALCKGIDACVIREREREFAAIKAAEEQQRREEEARLEKLKKGTKDEQIAFALECLQKAADAAFGDPNSISGAVASEEAYEEATSASDWQKFLEENKDASSIIDAKIEDTGFYRQNMAHLYKCWKRGDMSFQQQIAGILSKFKMKQGE